MKNRFFSIILALSMCLSLLPTMAVAADSEESTTHTHCICGAAHHEVGDHTDEERIEFTAWTDQLAVEQNGSGSTAANSLPSASGNYYLTGDVSLEKRWELKNDVVLCLNGHDIVRTKGSNSNSDVIYIRNKTFCLTDCQDSGKITHAEGINGRGVYVYAKTDEHSSFSMYAGAIANNHISTTDNYTYGGGVYVGAGSFTMYGGSIYGNSLSAKYSAYGGAVYAKSASNNSQKASFTLYAGNIYENSASSGGGVWVGEPSDIKMTGGSIYGNKAINGGGLYVNGCANVLLSGGSITGNTASLGGGVYQNNTSVPVELSGNIQIIGNVRNGEKDENTGMYIGNTADNYRLPTRSFSWELSPNFCFGIGEGLEDTARVGVTALYRNNDNSVVMKDELAFAKNAVEGRDYSRIFSCDQNTAETAYLPVYRVATTENNAEVLVFRKRWIVSFESNGGSAVDFQYFTPGNNKEYPVEEPTGVTREGYTLEGWYTSPDFAEDTKWDFTTNKASGNVTLYAKWNVNQYTITFDPDGGTAVDAVTQDYGTTITAPAAPTKTGYIFDGWNKEVPTTMPAENLKITATWKPITYKLVFDPNGGEGTMDALELTYDTSAALTEGGFTRTGYTFTGWNTQADGAGTAYEDQAQVENLTTEAGGAVTLYAQWDINQYTITFDTDGGTAVNAVTQDYGTAITAPAAPTKTGYTFAGWLPELPSTMPADGLELKAQWTANEGAIVFITGGGTAIDSITGHYGDPVTRPADPEREGYTFDGWDTEIPETLNEGTLTITAKWTVNQYTITFDTDGGTEVAAITQDYGTTITAPAAPTKTGYTFVGWTNLPSTMPAESRTVKARWSANSYTISFDTNGGSKIDAITQKYGTDITAPASPTKTGYTFAGWDQDIPANMPAENMKITAKWTVNQYIITFDTDGGSKISAITQDYGSKVTAPPNPTREGYTFKGWDKAVPSVMPAENVSIKALWEKNAEPDPEPDPEPNPEPDPEPDPEPNMPFVDVKVGDWFYDSVLWALERDITEGTSATTFSPARGCTRGQMVTFLWRAAGEPKANNPVNPFEDVKEGAYYYDAVLWAVEQGVTNGTSETTFEPDSICTRGQSVTFLWRYYGKPQSSDVDNPFADVKKGAYYYDAVLWAVEHGITNGVKLDLFAPNHMCTRAQSAAFLYRAMK